MLPGGLAADCGLTGPGEPEAARGGDALALLGLVGLLEPFRVESPMISSKGGPKAISY